MLLYQIIQSTIHRKNNWYKTLSTQDNTKLHQELKSGFKHTINWNKYQSKVFRENRFFVLPLKGNKLIH